ncbi:unnamed protein product [Caenorhabditis bovis]|uniref:Uncharacterized protein n=1 Tax=Caenorhabditis bovis TaxID=2654633 RepID=A0A8S1ELN1_9PELO|nr:unnamed protein product [Caenorhabditis bovis]
MRLLTLIGIIIVGVNVAYALRCVACIDDDFFDGEFFKNMTKRQIRVWKGKRSLPRCNDTKEIRLIECPTSCVYILAVDPEKFGVRLPARYYDCDNDVLADYLIYKLNEDDKFLYFSKYVPKGTMISDITYDLLDNIHYQDMFYMVSLFVVCLLIILHMIITKLSDIFNVILVDPNIFIRIYHHTVDFFFALKEFPSNLYSRITTNDADEIKAHDD